MRNRQRSRWAFLISLRQTVSSYNHRHHVSSAGTVTTAANRVHDNAVNAGRSAAVKAGNGDGRSVVTASNAPVRGTAAAPGAGHGGGRSK